MNKKEKDLSIIIISYNTRDLTAKSIESVYKYLLNKINFEVICFDNNSSDNSADLIRKMFPEVILICNSENIGFAKANNYCFDLSRSDNVLLMNSDVILLNDFLIGMVKFLRSSNRISIVGSKLIDSKGRLIISYGKFPTFFYNNFYSRIIYKFILHVFPIRSPVKVEWVSGAFFLIKKEALDKIGYFDERFWMYYEEMDLCRRIIKAGYHIYYYPQCTVVHFENEEFSLEKKKLRKVSRGLFYEKYHGKLFAKVISLFNI